jgi:nicotinamidase-related amidase
VHLVSVVLSTVAGSAPYPWPYDGSVPFSRLALVVCGWDQMWLRRAVGPEAPAAEVARLVEAMGALGGHVVAVAHAPRDGTPPDPLALPGAELVVAAGIDGFWGSPLDDLLRRRRVTHLLLAGHALEAPVHSTLRSANDRGYECLVVVDACSAIAPDLLDRTVSMIHMSGGIFGATATTADVLAAVGGPTDATPALTSPRRNQ